MPLRCVLYLICGNFGQFSILRYVGWITLVLCLFLVIVVPSSSSIIATASVMVNSRGGNCVYVTYEQDN